MSESHLFRLAEGTLALVTVTVVDPVTTVKPPSAQLKVGGTQLFQVTCTDKLSGATIPWAAVSSDPAKVSVVNVTATTFEANAVAGTGPNPVIITVDAA